MYITGQLVLSGLLRMQSLVDDDLTDDSVMSAETTAGTVPAWMKTLLESVSRWSSLLPKVQ